MKEALAQACKSLHLGYVMESYESIPFKDRTTFLLGVFEAELKGREAARIRRLLKKAQFPQAKQLEGYDFSKIKFPPHLQPRTADRAWVSRAPRERAHARAGRYGKDTFGDCPWDEGMREGT